MIWYTDANTGNVKFDEFDNALGIIDKIRDCKIDLADVRNDQVKLKSYLGEIKKRNKKHRSKVKKKTLCTILKCFT